MQVSLSFSRFKRINLNLFQFDLQLVAPIGQMAGNTLYYSGQAPTRLTESFPHLTIMIPVCKSSFL